MLRCVGEEVALKWKELSRTGGPRPNGPVPNVTLCRQSTAPTQFALQLAVLQASDPIPGEPDLIRSPDNLRFIQMP